MIGPRSFRRLVPLLGWLGPLGMGRPSHAFQGQVTTILAVEDAMPADLADIAVPAMVIVGNQDILAPTAATARSWPSGSRPPSSSVISGAAHGVMIEHALDVQQGAR